MQNVMPITVALAAAVLAAPGASAQVTSNRDPASPWSTVRQHPGYGDSAAQADTTFIREAIRGNFTEVALGRLAESRAEDDAVEDFAERMISDHNDMNGRWGQIARKLDMRTTVEFGPAGQQTIERLDDLEGAEFDRAYMTEMIRHHERDLAAFQRMASSARSADVRQLASSGASTIREHLALAQQVGRGVGVATTAGRVGSTGPVPAPSDDRARRTVDDRDDDREARSRLRGEDRVFVDGILSDHMMHVRLARRAQRDARDEQTRRLAERIEKDFTNWAERWARFADRRNAEVSLRLQPQHRARIERLKKAEGRNDLDRAYAAIVADHLEALVHDFREEANEKRPNSLRRLIREELPVLRGHLARARQLQVREDSRRN